MSVISSHVPDHVKEAAEAEARRHGMSLSEWLRCQLRKLTDTEPKAIDELDEAAGQRAA